ncbi:DNA-binding domain-containing protein [Spirochaeta cellobiosiphila]|uniref:HU family DNA-binding protein n=1 Tax=Spirochaeta cellobiosiphila TaxID=504483 RepID=UPI0004273B57|nr:DNA-binding domain-containing protein [Spirochaeta cellobiosiphila]
MIKYYLHQNKLTTAKEESRYLARIKSHRNISQEDLLSIMAHKNTTVSRQDILVVMDLLEEVVGEQLLQGNMVDTSIARFSLSVRGGFSNPQEDLSSDKHKLHLNAQPSNKLVKLIDTEARLSRVKHSAIRPLIDRLYDMSSQEYGEEFSRGTLMEIRGSMLKGEDSDKAGVFFIHRETGVVTKVTLVYRCLPASVLIAVPDDLVPGCYALEVRIQDNGVKKVGRYYMDISVV